MVRRITQKNTGVFLCGVLIFFVSASGLAAGYSGRVVYEDLSPAAGVVVYVLDDRKPLDVTNNSIIVSEHLERALSNERGEFTLGKVPQGSFFLFARDLEDNCVHTSVYGDKDGVGEIVLPRPAAVKGYYFEGDKPVRRQKINAAYLDGGRQLRYSVATVTGNDGSFEFDSMMPGKYLIEVIHEVPQVGCCFKSVIIKQKKLRLHPGQESEIKLGGTELPFLQGKITDINGKGLHGVWVSLEADNQGQSSVDPDEVWSDVTERDGGYSIYDIPPGGYRLHCFRRLALNDYQRTLQTSEDIVIHDTVKQDDSRAVRAENIRNVSIDMEPFEPLKYDEPAPEILGTLLNGDKFRLSDHRGKIVVLHFYTTWCQPCVASFPFFEEMAARLGSDKVTVLGISLDKDIGDCQKFISEKQFRHPQMYGGAWADSALRKSYRVIDVPTSFVIDKQGKIAQIDIFGPTLEYFINELLEGK